MENINTLVVGGGFGGIAAALRCKAMGHNVTIIDKLSKLGGRAQVIERNGYKYDTGPTVITCLLYTSDAADDLWGVGLGGGGGG